MESVLDSFAELCIFYSRQALTLAESTSEPDEIKNCVDMAEALENISHKTPASFREELQLVYLYNKFDGAKNYGRMDDYLADLYHDDLVHGRIDEEVNVPSAQKAFDVPYEKAVHVIQYGCGEYVLNHRSVGTPSGVINLLQALLVTMNRGIDPSTGKNMGMPLERYLKYGNFNRFEDLFAAYKEQVEYHVGPLALQEYLEYVHASEDNAYLSSSILG